MPETQNVEAAVAENRAQSRYDIHVSNTLAGFAEFVDHGNRRIFYHTEIFEQFGGKGLSNVLIREALADVRAKGLRVVAICPAVKAYIGKHSDFDDIVEPVAREDADAVRERVARKSAER